MQLAASYRLRSHFPGRRGFLRLVVLFVLSVWAVESDTSLLVANEALVLLLKSVDLLLIQASNLL
jgi:hypothetical protein